jgi:hypothetical protein
MREQRKDGVEPAWSFSLPLSEDDTIELEGSFPSSVGSFDLVGLGEMVQRTFRARIPGRQEPVTEKVSPVLP